MDKLEKIFDDIIKEREKERRLKDEYFADIKKKSLDFINYAYGKFISRWYYNQK